MTAGTDTWTRVTPGGRYEAAARRGRMVPHRAGRPARGRRHLRGMAAPVSRITWGNAYWPVWLGVLLAAFLPGEILGLIQGGQNTLSNFVWQYLKLAKNEAIWQWSALDFLIFGAWVTVVVWLTAHLFFMTFALYAYAYTERRPVR